MTTAIRSLVAFLLAIAWVLTGTADAQDAARRRPEQIPRTGAEDSAQPTPEEEAAARFLDAITSRSTEGLTFEQRPDGTIGLDLQGRFMHVLRATPGKDGHLGISCHTGGNPELSHANAVKP